MIIIAIKMTRLVVELARVLARGPRDPREGSGRTHFQSCSIIKNEFAKNNHYRVSICLLLCTLSCFVCVSIND